MDKYKDKEKDMAKTTEKLNLKVIKRISERGTFHDVYLTVDSGIGDITLNGKDIVNKKEALENKYNIIISVEEDDQSADNTTKDVQV